MNEFESKQAEWDLTASASADFKAQVGRPFDDSAWLALSCDVLDKLVVDDQKGLSILDVGCGNGLLLSKLSSHFEQLTGVDYSKAMIEKANQLLPSALFYQYQANQLNFNDGHFDRVLSYSIFHYFPSYEYAIETILEMIRVTKRGGIILLGDLLDDDYEETIKNNSDLEYEKTIPLIHRYSQWRFFNFKKLVGDLAQYVDRIEVLSQPDAFPLSDYRKDIRLWV